MREAAHHAMLQSKALRVAIEIANPQRRKELAQSLAAAGYVIVEHWKLADVLLGDNESILPPDMPGVVLGGRVGAAGLLPLDATPEQIDAALRAVAAGLVVHGPGPGERAFGPVGDFDETVLLTPRELQVLDAIAAGLTNKAIARQLGISLHTVKFHIESLFRKLDAHTRTEVVAKARERRRVETISL